ncbi:pyridoxamine 5'-phosphate oxidase family protein [Amycolatopsis sp. NPDC023774]|uniref:pyridoxamine 5'-phosphate oxidase family protein n=1 Tax=Amycolatopsis sp. NPDC023774 TaxID=3155015 RepID=UPI00340CB4E6
MTELRPLTTRECIDLLSTQPVGRLVFSENALPAIRPVNFSVHEGNIIVRSSRTGSVAKLRDEVVAFEVDSIDLATRTGWSVVVLGKANPITEIDELVALAEPRHRPWPGGERSHFVRIPIEVINGRMFHVSDAGATQPCGLGRQE